jgi:hypothetical protein
MTASHLPPEVVSLVHHLELNRTGWWDTAIEKLILAVLWRADRGLNPADILAGLRDSYSLPLGQSTIANRIHTLKSRRDVITQADGTLTLAEAARALLDSQVVTYNELLARLRSHAASLVPATVSETLRASTWDQLYDGVLVTWIRSTGAHAYRLFASSAGADRVVAISAHIEAFLSRYPLEVRQPLKATLESWLASKDPDLRAVVLQTLNAHFVLEASRLDKGTLDALLPRGAALPKFHLFVDTNLLFSLLALHDNPANEAASALLEVIQQLHGRAEIKLYVLGPTIDETKRAITARLGPLKHLRLTQGLSGVATELLHGIDRRFAEECKKAGVPLLPDDFFGPYLYNLVPVLRTKGIEFYNTSVDAYATRPDVVDAINDALEREKLKAKERRKGYEQIAHDMVLWHVVKDRRAATIESPLDAISWVATIDLGLLGFDFYRRRDGLQVPICIHPTTLVQMLQFWVPRSPAFERALFGSLGLPALFQDFDPVTEGVTVKILQGLSRFENVDDLPPETVKAVLVNASLRQRLRNDTTLQQEVELVKEVLVEENRLKEAALAAERAEKTRLATELAERAAQVAALESSLRTKAEEKMAAEAALHGETERSLEAERRVLTLETSMRLDGERRREAVDRRRRLLFATGSSLLLVAFLSTVALSPMVLGHWSHLSPFESRVICSSLALLAWAELVVFVGKSIEAIRSVRGFVLFRKYRGATWALLGALLVTVLGNAAFDWIKTKSTVTGRT